MHRRVVPALTDDQDSVDLDCGYARDGRSALWVHVADDEADRGLARLRHAARPALRPPQTE